MYKDTLKFLGIFVAVILFGWVVTPIHEGIHFLWAKTAGVETVIRLTWAGAGSVTYVGEVPTGATRFFIGLSGGMGTALIFGILWLLSRLQLRYSVWELDNTTVFFFFVLMQFIYAWFDATNVVSTSTATGISLIVALVGTSAVYGKRLIEWIYGARIH
ncbi:hypothetical protein CMI37_33245 [Candidatus Pacearchaeota archaeon]|nr:hypothetical protein [Candidatus Pacearchaeota archaeon]|tara:strand:+ start:3799 stop:4275 length:477 start_codon:yes stop_codon:yes gene_type:complete